MRQSDIYYACLTLEYLANLCTNNASAEHQHDIDTLLETPIVAVYKFREAHRVVASYICYDSPHRSQRLLAN